MKFSCSPDPVSPPKSSYKYNECNLSVFVLSIKNSDKACSRHLIRVPARVPGLYHIVSELYNFFKVTSVCID